MKLDRANAVLRPHDGGGVVYLCSEHCAAQFDAALGGARERPPAARSS
jgi:YHS domain-containing protein